MESEQFDRLARSLGTNSRRQVLFGLVATALAALAPRRTGAACQEGTVDQFACGTRECIGGEFVEFFDDAGTVCRAAEGECDLAESCSGSSFACPSDRKKANGAACSSDGNPCTNDICQGGQCVHVPNTAPCADDGNTCTTDICANGACTHPVKADGSACPEGACCGGQCLDTGFDEANCGSCGRTCALGATCCSGNCVELATNRQNCGRCGKQCNGSRCRNGRCQKRKRKKKR